MKNKITRIIVSICMISVLSGCGNNESTVSEVPEYSATEESKVDVPEASEVSPEVATDPIIEEDVSTEISAETEAVETEEATEEKTDDETVWSGELTDEWAIEKMKKVSEAYSTLENNFNKETEAHAQLALAVGLDDMLPVDGLKTADDNSLNKMAESGINGKVTLAAIYFQTICKYYYDFINNDGEYFDFADYISSHDMNDLVIYYNAMSDDTQKEGREVLDTNYGTMYNMQWIPSLCNGEMTIENVTNEPTVAAKHVILIDGSKADVASQCDIYLDGKDTGIKAVFDKDGNFLNFNDDEANIEKEIPFK